MVIQWYPGHMSKALKMIDKEIKIVDAIIYVLDARAPFSCLNPKFTKLIDNKPFIYVLNKADMTNDEITKQWNSYFSKKGVCITLNSIQSGSAKKLESALFNVLKDKMQRFKDKNIFPTIRAMVIGVPNCGKSTLINNLSNKAKTLTGNKPGVTKGKQWIKLSDKIEVLDTPGTLWPAFNNNKIAKHLAYIGSIKEQVLDINGLSLEFINDINLIDPNILKLRYNIDYDLVNTPSEILGKICISRGLLVKGGKLDYERASLLLINEFKQGKLGKISLETVNDINEMLVNDRSNETD